MDKSETYEYVPPVYTNLLANLKTDGLDNLTLKQLETIIREIQIQEKFRSPRQVFEKYVDLSALYIVVMGNEISEKTFSVPENETSQSHDFEKSKVPDFPENKE